MSEADLTANTKKLVVKVENKLVHRIKMGKVFQLSYSDGLGQTMGVLN